jgi:hypothetical protein
MPCFRFLRLRTLPNSILPLILLILVQCHCDELHHPTSAAEQQTSAAEQQTSAAEQQTSAAAAMLLVPTAVCTCDPPSIHRGSVAEVYVAELARSVEASAHALSTSCAGLSPSSLGACEHAQQILFRALNDLRAFAAVAAPTGASHHPATVAPAFSAESPGTIMASIDFLVAHIGRSVTLTFALPPSIDISRRHLLLHCTSAFVGA